jgi:dTDP-4-amino-4,6-dideoxygalactose transaminase
MHLALKALKIKPGDEVIVPAFSYIATANVVELVGAKPVFVDIDLETFCIDTKQILLKISKSTKAIIPVHEFGLCANMDEILKIADDNKIFVIEDAACALGASINDKMAGTFGDFGSFSLHPRKSITSGEGGLLVTKKKIYDDQIKILRNHGIRKNNQKIEFVEAGFNYRMTDIQAALANSQFKRLKNIINHKSKQADIYTNNLNKNKYLLPKVPIGYKHSWQSYHIIVKNGKRDQITNYLRERQIFLNYGAQCIPFTKFYHEKYKYNVKVEFPNAYNAFKNGLCLPLGENYDKNITLKIIELLNYIN